MKTNNIVTADLSEFGYREIKQAQELLTAYVKQGSPSEFFDQGIRIMFNQHSGFVFLTNEEYQVLMMNGDELEMFYSLPYSGEEGFADELRELYEEDKEYFHEEDIEYMQQYEIID